jgi:hypothetical protein
MFAVTLCRRSSVCNINIIRCRSYDCTKRQLRIVFCLETAKLQFDNTGGVRNLRLTVFFIHNLTFCSDEARFSLSSYVNSQSNGCWSTENSHAVHEVPVPDVKVRLLCAISARGITDQFSLTKH